MTTTVARAPGLSVRLRLTLSYAGFLVVASALLLAAVWLFLLSHIPDTALLTVPPTTCPSTAPRESAPSTGRGTSC